MIDNNLRDMAEIAGAVAELREFALEHPVSEERLTNRTPLPEEYFRHVPLSDGTKLTAQMSITPVVRNEQAAQMIMLSLSVTRMEPVLPFIVEAALSEGFLPPEQPQQIESQLFPGRVWTYFAVRYLKEQPKEQGNGSSDGREP